MPWRVVTANLNLLDSHDTPRFRTITGSSELTAVGIGWLLAHPGVPMLFAGDELGYEGDDSNSTRRVMRWDGSGDRALLAFVQRAVAARRSSPALRVGGLRWAQVDDDVIVFLRETAGERVIVQVARSAHAPVQLPAHVLGADGVGAPLLDHEPLVAHAGSVQLPSTGPAVRWWRASLGRRR